MLWHDIRTAPSRHMQMAFHQRRRRIELECRQIKTDVDSYNDAHPEEFPIQMVLDFTRDVEEFELERDELSSKMRSSYSKSEQKIQFLEAA